LSAAPDSFNRLLNSYSSYSNVIESVLEDDFRTFSFRDSELLWDSNRSIALMNRHNYAILFRLDYFASTGLKPIPSPCGQPPGFGTT
jgi:hypothetical protein